MPPSKCSITWWDVPLKVETSNVCIFDISFFIQCVVFKRALHVEFVHVFELAWALVFDREFFSLGVCAQPSRPCQERKGISLWEREGEVSALLAFLWPRYMLSSCITTKVTEDHHSVTAKSSTRATFKFVERELIVHFLSCLMQFLSSFPVHSFFESKWNRKVWKNLSTLDKNSFSSKKALGGKSWG